MSVFKALGLGVVILILQLLMSDVFHALEGTILQLFEILGSVLDSTQEQLQ